MVHSECSFTVTCMEPCVHYNSIFVSSAQAQCKAQRGQVGREKGSERGEEGLLLLPLPRAFSRPTRPVPGDQQNPVASLDKGNDQFYGLSNSGLVAGAELTTVLDGG